MTWSEEYFSFNEEANLINASNLQKIHSITIYAQNFLHAFKRLSDLKKELEILEFEKDDDLCLKFVSAAANLRCHIFSLNLQSDYEVKEIAGNVIPAICSTNAIVSAVEVLEAMKFLAKKERNKECYVQNDRVKKINAINPMKPNSKVYFIFFIVNVLSFVFLVPCLQ